MKHAWLAVAVVASLSLVARAQDSTAGLSIPITISGSAMNTERLQSEDPGDSPVAAGFRAVMYPLLKIDEHWFGYAAIQIREAPYFYYDAFDSEREFYAQVIQAFVGYSIRHGQNNVVIKAGRLNTAFGAFPVRYDDAENPLLDQPLSYITDTPVRADTVIASVAALRNQYYGSGLVPVTLYSIPGIEADVSSGKFDARAQIVSGSPANPQSAAALGKYRQWAAGGGFTIRQGFRVGMSAFRGPYLGRNVAALLPAGSSIRNFPATGIGIDAQWARGRWSLNGEWQRFQFDSPNFTTSPAIQSGYVEAKSIVTPRLFLAARAGYLKSSAIADASGARADSFAPALAAYEFGGGYWAGRNELIKASYEILHAAGSSGTRMNVLGAEFVFRFHSLAWSFR